MRVLFRCDASPAVGGGHAVRCMALADQLLEAGHKVAWCGHWDLPFLERIAQERRWSFSPPTWDIPQLAALVAAQHADWLVVDSYEPGPQWFQHWRRANHARVLALVDDPSVTLDADMVLNQNLDAELGSGGSLSGTSLRGSQYAMVRQGVLDARSCPRPTPGPPWKVLLMMGGGDPGQWTLRVAEWILAMPAAVEVTAVTPLHLLPSLSALAAPPRLVVLPPQPSVERLMVQSDLAISAAGSTCWELCALGVPMCLLVAAENQRVVAAALKGAGVAQLLDGNLGTADTDTFTSLLNPSLLATLGPHLRALVDGEGASRVVQAMAAALHARRTP